MNSGVPVKKKLGDELISRGLVTREQIVSAIQAQKQTGQPLGHLLVDMGFVTEHTLKQALSEIFNTKIVNLSSIAPNPGAIKLIPKNLAQELNILPIAYHADRKVLEVAMVDIYNVTLLDKIRAQLDKEIIVDPVLSGKSEIQSYIEKYYNPVKKRLGDQLTEKGLVTKDQVELALSEQKKSGLPLGKMLVELGFLSESILRDVLGETLGAQSIELKNVIPDSDAIKLIPNDIAKKYNILPIVYHRQSKKIDIAMTDIHNIIVFDKVRSILPPEVEINPIISGETEIRSALDRFYGYEMSVDGIIKELETGVIDYASLNNEAEYNQPIVRLVNSILTDAVKKGASDIHFEPEEKFLRLRYRIDGVMRQIKSLNHDYWSAMTVRLKVVSNMNIAEAKMAQDGRITLKISGRQVDFRCASQPTKWGENIVLRILDREKSLVPLEGLGLFTDNLNLLKMIMARPEGIILVTGPTGSGKTTTLYSMLNYRKSVAINIMTLEDPIEYPMDLIRQTDLSDTTRMDFASGIKSLMRQDPDVILIGEIRDEETAEMAFRAAMTGHQVFATLHTNSALGSIPRLKNIGVKPDILGSNIIGAIGQRLIRKLCLHCKVAKKPNEQERKLLGISLHEESTIYEAAGCMKCDFIGYKGRISILEICKFDEGLESLISKDASQSEVKEYAIKHGYKTLADDAIRRVIAGDTSIEEISRVVDLTDRLS